MIRYVNTLTYGKVFDLIVPQYRDDREHVFKGGNQLCFRALELRPESAFERRFLSIVQVLLVDVQHGVHLAFHLYIVLLSLGDCLETVEMGVAEVMLAPRPEQGQRGVAH